jgi:hypothetical protein
MVKPPVEQDRFRVLCSSVEITQLGAVMAALAKIGIRDVQTELVTDVITFNKRVTHDTNAENFLREKWLPDHPTFKAKEAVTFFDLHGRTAGAAYTALRMLTQSGELKKLGEGNYARKDVKQLAAPKKKTVAAKAREKAATRKPHGNGKSNPQFALDFAAKHGGQLVRADVMKAMEKVGRNNSGTSAMLRNLIEQKKIEHVSEGIYKLASSSLNGASQHG